MSLKIVNLKLQRLLPRAIVLTHWGRVTHICVGNLTIIASHNGLSPGRRQAIIWTNVGILLIGPLGTNFNENLIIIHTFSFTKIHLKMSSAKWRPFCLGLNVLTCKLEQPVPDANLDFLSTVHVPALSDYMIKAEGPMLRVWTISPAQSILWRRHVCISSDYHAKLPKLFASQASKRGYIFSVVRLEKICKSNCYSTASCQKLPAKRAMAIDQHSDVVIWESDHWVRFHKYNDTHWNKFKHQILIYIFNIF